MTRCVLSRARRTAAVVAAAALAAGGVAVAQGGAPPPAQQPPPVTEIIGRSVQGRAIDLIRIGDPAARRRVLVVGCVHGDECAARAVVDVLRRFGAAPPGVELLLVRVGNPDGLRRHTRQNARGVDLNRNSGQRWRPLAGAQYSGRRPWSEPETRALRDLVGRERPALVIWYHQPFGLVDAPEAGSAAVARAYARLTGLPFHPLLKYPGSLSRWVNARVRAGSSFVVELPPGRLGRRAAVRHAGAVLTLAAKTAR